MKFSYGGKILVRRLRGPKVLMDLDDRILVAGAGGFIEGHLVRRLMESGFKDVRAVDVKTPSEWFQARPDASNVQLDLAGRAACQTARDGIDVVFNLAADIGGMGFIEINKAACMRSALINTHLLMAARDRGVTRYFYSSSACVYAEDTDGSRCDRLKEADAYPAVPEDGYGWKMLFSERMCRHFTGWAPVAELETGMEKTYRWTHDQMVSKRAA